MSGEAHVDVVLEEMVQSVRTDLLIIQVVMTLFDVLMVGDISADGRIP